MGKLRLDSDPEPDVFLIAISSHVNDYRLTWALNNGLEIELGRRPSDIKEQGPEQMAHFAVFDHMDEATRENITLISNHAPEGVLIADQRQADYFLVVDGNDPRRSAEMLDRVRASEFVLAAYLLDFKAVKGALKLMQ